MRNQHGGVTLVMAALIVIAMLAVAGILRVGAAAAGRARTQAAADAVALAGADRGRSAAEAVAVANGARILDYESDGDDVTVTVRRGAHTATARARWEPTVGDRAGANRVRVPASRTLSIRGHEATR